MPPPTSAALQKAADAGSDLFAILAPYAPNTWPLVAAAVVRSYLDHDDVRAAVDALAETGVDACEECGREGDAGTIAVIAAIRPEPT